MHGMQNFAFDDALVRVVTRQEAPWFVGIDVCACLGLMKPHQALDALDDDERTTCAVGTPSGEQTMIIISEPGVYRLVFRSRKPAAERFKRWLAHDVLPKLRRDGRYDAADQAADRDGDPRPELTAESTLHKLHLIREARALFGRARAAVLWRQLGLPAVPPPPPTALDEARVCLRQLLDGAIGSDDSVRHLIECALEDDEEARIMLRASGVRLVTDGSVEGFAVANQHMGLERVYSGSDWSRGRWMRVLRRLPGTAALGPMRFDLGNDRPPGRSTFIPAHYLDEEGIHLRRSIMA